MLKFQVIGNLGADAELHQSNGNEFISFRVAHTEQYNNNGQQTQRTTWVDVTWNGNGGNLLQYLKKGAKVFVDGVPTFRVYSSAKDRCWKAGVSIFARTIELCGGSSDPVPRELVTHEGMVVQINKHFHCPDDSVHGSILYDRNMNQYKVDGNGFIISAASPAESAADGSQQPAE